ncbi:MAG: site-2 protease family protein [Candidatus Woesearchaeota archaeon]
MIFDFILFITFVVFAIAYLVWRRKSIILQPILAFGPVHIISMVLVKRKWGIALMDYIAKKYTAWVQMFGYISIGAGFLGIALNLILLVFMVRTLLETPSLQQVALVLPFQEIPHLGYLSFVHWIIAIFILATVHEFAHGVVARAWKVPVDSSGFAFLSLFRWIPVIPAAFVEPNQKKFQKTKDYIQYAVLGAGPISNILLAIPFALMLLFLFPAIDAQVLEFEGIYFEQVNQSHAAGIAGVQARTIYSTYNNQTIDPNLFFAHLQYRYQPGDTIYLGNENRTHVITLDEHPNIPGRAYLGIIGIHTRYDYSQDFSENLHKPYEWIKELIKWLFIFNLGIGLINLMPLYITDGGQFVRIFAQKWYPNQANKIYHIICGAALYILLAALLIPFFF